MKKRICFAGFGEAEVEALQPALAAAASRWECVFCPDGASAIETLGRDSFAAVVVDLRMEGMSGVGLLQLAAGNYPRTLRFALGDFADREAVVNNIGAPHQFISRPWSLEELLAIVERSLALDSWLSSDKLRAFVPQLGRLPSLPATYFEILRRAESPKATVESIGEIIARDPALTARILQTVNSAAAAVGEKITDPIDAVSVLGLDTVKSLVLCLQVFNPSASAPTTGITLDALWRHSFDVAQLSRKIALRYTSDARVASDAFTAGLLHRVGQIVLTTNMAKEYGDIVNEACAEKRPLHEVELEKLGVASAQVGAYLLGLWGMPWPLVEAAALYIEPSRSTGREFSLLTAVHVADALTQEEKPLAEGLPIPKLDRSYLKALKLPEKPDAWRKDLAGGQMTAPVRPDEPAPKPKPRPAKTSSDAPRPTMAWIAVAALVAAIGLGAWKWYSTPKEQRKIPFLAATPKQESTPDPKTATPAETTPDAAPDTSALDSIKIQAVIYSAKKPVALINGNPVSPGDRVNGVLISAITSSNVVLSIQGQQRTVKWK
ncbi:MAG TPA: HDOD domain-containing protein [Verrucomicrobiae bacterium]|jgi:HD-like signal output (HDOD) protein|nr:HDOD domain-containing protein [Verrucomicrobiae bacterium]